MSYELGVDLPDGCPRRVPRGTNLLVTGPPMVGKRRLVLDLLAAGRRRDEGGLLITTEATNEQVAEAYAAHESAGPPLRIVDAVGEGGSRGVNDRYAVEFVPSPGDLTGLGIAMNKALDAFAAEGVGGVRVGLDSLSTLLTYLDAERVFKFLHVLSGRVASIDALGVYTLNTAAVDPQVVGMFKNTVDGVVRLDEDETRVDGFDGVTG